MYGDQRLETFLRTGQLVGGQYRVQNLIAKGGMAAVWEGVNEHTGKRVALKVILQSFASNTEATELFRREALVASKVNHPNVVNIFDVIDHEGMTCIVMELLQGQTLASYMARTGPLSLERTLGLLLPAMGGVAAVNAQGVVHRDLKPGNIFLCCGSDGEVLTTKVLDFGVSVMMRRAGDTAPLTELAATLGTPAYMAPEAIESSPSIDGRADVYGFGVLFFEMLTGKLPFIGPPGMDLLKRILTEPAPMVTLYRPDLPYDVVSLIARALSKDPNDRFADMQHLIRATEDRLLPLLPGPRSLTPIPGCRLHLSTEEDVKVSVPKVQAPFEKEVSGSAKLTETRAIYSLPRAQLRMPHGPGRRLSRSPCLRRLFRRQVAIGVALVAFLTVTAWVSAPASSVGGALAQQRIATSAVSAPMPPAPPMTPLPPTPPPPSLPTVDPEIVETVANIPRPSIRASTQYPSPHVSSARPPKQHPSLPEAPKPPRAGRLSASDF